MRRPQVFLTEHISSSTTHSKFQNTIDHLAEYIDVQIFSEMTDDLDGLIKMQYELTKFNTSIVITDEQLFEQTELHLFLVRVFIYRDFKNMMQCNEIKQLIQFQARNKYMFMALSPMLQKKLGQLIAAHKTVPLEQTFELYEKQLLEILVSRFAPGSLANAYQHVYGYFSENLSTELREEFQQSLRGFLQGNVTEATIQASLIKWADMYEETYIQEQTLLKPYPEALRGILN